MAFWNQCTVAQSDRRMMMMVKRTKHSSTMEEDQPRRDGIVDAAASTVLNPSRGKAKTAGSTGQEKDLSHSIARIKLDRAGENDVCSKKMKRRGTRSSTAKRRQHCCFREFSTTHRRSAGRHRTTKGQESLKLVERAESPPESVPYILVLPTASECPSPRIELCSRCY